ncbi:hypothetical protein [Photobacterium nomapromontoriensis]|uniref:hypothetical protein n=1 Tax=Photobacterium nomapromontoriensis TaxID=2910237 RepID=UPI003D1239D9
MSPAVLSYYSSRYPRYFIWGAVILLLIGVLLFESHSVHDKAIQVRAEVLAQTLQTSASALHQEWEFAHKPSHAVVDGIPYAYTQKGWPVVWQNGQVDCAKTWELLSSRVAPVKYSDVISKSEVRSGFYNSCYYQVGDGKWLALFYENETMHTNVFLTPPEQR